MPDYWIDSSVYVSSRRGILAFDIAPRFWNYLHEFGLRGRVASPREVYVELQRHFGPQDDLIVWLRAREDTYLKIPTPNVQEQFSQIADYLVARYTPYQAQEFLRGADPWLVAHSVEEGGLIVTNEVPSQEPNPSRSTGLIDTKVKIPNVARAFGANTVSLTQMLRNLGVNDL